jgi:hypothetical protein
MEFKRVVAWLEDPADYGLFIIMWVMLILTLIWLLQGGPK